MKATLKHQLQSYFTHLQENITQSKALKKQSFLEKKEIAQKRDLLLEEKSSLEEAVSQLNVMIDKLNQTISEFQDKCDKIDQNIKEKLESLEFGVETHRNMLVDLIQADPKAEEQIKGFFKSSTKQLRCRRCHTLATEPSMLKASCSLNHQHCPSCINKHSKCPGCSAPKKVSQIPDIEQLIAEREGLKSLLYAHKGAYLSRKYSKSERKIVSRQEIKHSSAL